MPGDQRWDPAQYAEHARFVSELGGPVVDLLAPRAGERILDLGCGDGELTARIQALGCEVLGVDASAEMVAAAAARGLTVRRMDGQALDFDAEFDAVFSNAALHWMRDPARVIAGVRRALRPGGRFAGELGGRGNVSAIVGALEGALSARGLAAPSPWFFPDVEEYRTLLEAGGLTVERIERFPRPTPLPGDVGAWVETLAQPYLTAVPAGERPALIAEVVDALRDTLSDGRGNWFADYVRLRFLARKPAPAAGP